MLENYELVQKGFRILHPLMAGYIGREFSRVYKDGWWQEVLDALSAQHDLPESGDYGELIDSLDVMNCLRLRTGWRPQQGRSHWRAGFFQELCRESSGYHGAHL